MAQAQYDDINIAVKYIIYEVNALDMYVLFVAIQPWKYRWLFLLFVLVATLNVEGEILRNLFSFTDVSRTGV